MNDVSLRCLGAAGTVTGSKHLLEIAGRRILVDCGLFQGLKELRTKNWRELPVAPSSIDVVVLTHAHIDHSGYLPRLIRDGFDGRVLATPATADLARLLLRDAGYLQEEEAAFHNKRRSSKHDPALPLYTAEEGAEAADRIEELGYDRSVSVVRGSDRAERDVRLTFHPAGHILGSATATFEIVSDTETKRFVFSGDLGPRDSILHLPATPPGVADALVVESTYGDRLHPEDDPAEKLAGVIHRAVKRGGALLVPAFAVARTQTLLYLISQLERRNEIPTLPVYLDSPMAIDATEIYRQHGAELRPEIRQALREGRGPLRPHDFHVTRTPELSKRINDLEGPFILISASGMITGGRILHHLAHRLSRPETTIMFAGYQSIGTRGWRLQRGETKLRLFGRNVWVRAEVETLDGLSAHGDQEDLMAWLAGTLPRVEDGPKTFIVHGEEKPAAALASRIRRDLGWSEVTAPQEGAVYPL
ncbi:MAG: MBL fold metallo-hydrolase [Thermoanaerobaculia bacterium]|nr:MBL fold metallo-hydrolase [Thermoanaerobaculia bacterium]